MGVGITHLSNIFWLLIKALGSPSRKHLECKVCEFYIESP